MIEPTAKRMTRYLSVILRWLLVLAAVFALTVISGVYVIDNVLPKVYRASATIELPAGDVVTPTAPTSISEPEPFQPEFANTILAPDFLLAVVKDLGLDKVWARRIYKTDQEQVPDVDALTRMENSLTLEIIPGTTVVRVTASSDLPQEAAAIANAVTDRYRAVRAMSADPAAKSVRILERAVAPAYPAKPRRTLDMTLTFILAVFLGVSSASFVEIIFLFVRAGERTDN